MPLIAVLSGDGIGPEVMEASLPVVATAAKSAGLKLEFERALVGGAAFDATGHPLPPETLALCDKAAAIYFGAVGGPKYDKIPDPSLRPERGALLPLRKRYTLYANVRPAVVYKGLENKSALKPDYIKGMNMLVVRELVGGAYFGKKELKETSAFDVIEYDAAQVERVLRFAFQEPWSASGTSPWCTRRTSCSLPSCGRTSGTRSAPSTPRSRSTTATWTPSPCT